MHQVEARVNKIQWFVWNYPPKPRPYFFMFPNWGVMWERSIAHFGKEWERGTQTKRALIYGIVLGNKSSSHLELWRDILSQVVLCTSNFRNFPVRAYLPLYQLRFFPVVLAPRQRSHLWSCFTVHSDFFRGKIASCTFFSFSFTFSCSFFFQFHLPFCYIELL